MNKIFFGSLFWLENIILEMVKPEFQCAKSGQGGFSVFLDLQACSLRLASLLKSLATLIWHWN